MAIVEFVIACLRVMDAILQFVTMVVVSTLCICEVYGVSLFVLLLVGVIFAGPIGLYYNSTHVYIAFAIVILMTIFGCFIFPEDK